MGMGPKTSVILVREWEQQMSGSGCCGRLEGDFLGCGENAVFKERRAIMERMGPVYRAIRARFGDAVDMQIVDPRNFTLLLLLLRDFWTFRVGLGTAMRTLSRLPKQGVVVNGRIADRTADPDVNRIVAAVEAATSRVPEARHA